MRRGPRGLPERGPGLVAGGARFLATGLVVLPLSLGLHLLLVRAGVDVHLSRAPPQPPLNPVRFTFIDPRRGGSRGLSVGADTVKP